MSRRKVNRSSKVPDRKGVSSTRRLSRANLRLESLESREMMAADVRAINGSNNNLANPTWGSAGVDLLRRAPAAYADGISTPAGAALPSARAISDAVSAQTADTTSDRNLSAYIYAWGQFLDHDIDLTPSASPSQAFNIAVPKGDAYFDPNSTGTQIIPLSRSLYDAATGTSKANPRQQINTITAFVDGSQVYGSDSARAAALRTFSGGHMKTSGDDLLPLNTAGLANANDAHVVPDNQLFLAGDIRANENIELSSMQTMFVREHNRLADKLGADHPKWTDEQIYQQARRLVIGELQAITYNEFLPALIGRDAMKPYAGYNPAVNPGITNEFSTAAFRVGHSLLGDDIEFMDNDGNAVHDEVALRDAFFNPTMINSLGIDPVLKYLASTNAQQIDTKVVDEVRNFLFGPPGAGGFDLAALNIQRGRDNGLSDYNTTRAAYGLPKVTSFAQITSDVDMQNKLKSLYGDVNHIDLWVGGLAEDHVAGAAVGATFQRIIADQFQRLRDGDRYWYQRDLSGPDLQFVQNTKLSDIIRLNTEITNVQENAFVFNPTITGRVFADADRNGRLDRNENGLGGITVQLLDSEGAVVATALTMQDGGYKFNVTELGTYHIRELLAPGMTTTTTPGDIDITRSMNVSLDLGVAPPIGQRPPAQPQPRPNQVPSGGPGPGRGPAPMPSAADVIFAGMGMPGQPAGPVRL